MQVLRRRKMRRALSRGGSLSLATCPGTEAGRLDCSVLVSSHRANVLPFTARIPLSLHRSVSL